MSNHDADSDGVETRTYTRDDGWEVVMRVKDQEVVYLSHLPIINTPRPFPITTEYVEQACRAHGYAPVTSPD